MTEISKQANDPQFNGTIHPVLPESGPQGQSVFRISPLIWVTLWCLYLALTIPLPFMANITAGGVSAKWLLPAIALGGIALHAALSERVILDAEGIRVSYPTWVPTFFRRGWHISWSDIQDLKPRSTSQGGLVYYLLSASGQAYLLPMRVVGFARLVRQVQAKTGIDTTVVRPLAQPWMYSTLLLFTLMLGLADAWVIVTALTQ